MKKLFCILLSCVALAVLAQAQEGASAEENSSALENAFLVQKEIAVWRTDKAKVDPEHVYVYSCQAVRLAKKWFLTAAHCVYPACRGAFPCTVEITLAQEPGQMRQRVRVEHTRENPQVFIYEGFFPGQNRISSTDVALIKVDPARATYAYEVWDKQQENFVSVGKAQFDKLLRDSPEMKAQLETGNIRLVSSALLSGSARLLLPIEVPLVRGGTLSYLGSGARDVFYVGKLHHFISPSFGVARGNSGGGVFAENGDLIGLVSSLVYSENGSVSFQNDEGETALTLQHARDYFLFTGFNGNTMNFIRNKVSSLRTIGAENGFVVPVEEDFAGIVKAIDSAPLVM